MEYSTKLGRRTIGSKSVGVVQTRNNLKDKGISNDFMKSFQRRLWALDMLEKIKVWLRLLSHKAVHVREWLSSRGGEAGCKLCGQLWLLSHKAVPIEESLSSRGGEVGCKLCGHALESIPHRFWNWTVGISIWCKSLTIVTTCNVNGKDVWGSIHGLTLKWEGWEKQLNPHGHGFI